MLIGSLQKHLRSFLISHKYTDLVKIKIKEQVFYNDNIYLYQRIWLKHFTSLDLLVFVYFKCRKYDKIGELNR